MKETLIMKNLDMNTALELLKQEIISDYEAFQNRGCRNVRTEIQARMLDDFINGLRVEEGRKYYKVISGSSVWGFIVKVAGKFQVGDILKPAGWAAPATNAARGNVFEEYTVQWTGPLYLR